MAEWSTENSVNYLVCRLRPSNQDLGELFDYRRTFIRIAIMAQCSRLRLIILVNTECCVHASNSVSTRWRPQGLEAEARSDTALRPQLLPLLRVTDHTALLRGGQLGGHEAASQGHKETGHSYIRRTWPPSTTRLPPSHPFSLPPPLPIHAPLLKQGEGSRRRPVFGRYSLCAWLESAPSLHSGFA